MVSNSIVFSNDPRLVLKNYLETKNYSKIAVLTDTNTLVHCYPLIEASLSGCACIVMEAGEENKNLTTCSYVWSQLTHHEFDRHSLLVVLGGGVVGDLGGFCAATYKRGIDFILIPTTLLAQADASIGGKLGIDFQHFKNQVGLFKEPVFTILSAAFLKTLPEQELKSGFAEVIKHTLLSDIELFNSIKATSLSDQNFQNLVKHSAEFKQSIVNQDPEEKGLRKILNFGHTIGHAIESDSIISSKRVLHGEAIAAGMVAESHIAFQKRMMSKEDLTAIATYLISLFGKTTVNEQQTLSLIAQDKKNRAGKIRMALITKIGHPKWDIEVSEEEILESIRYYTSL